MPDRSTDATTPASRRSSVAAVGRFAIVRNDDADECDEGTTVAFEVIDTADGAALSDWRTCGQALAEALRLAIQGLALYVVVGEADEARDVRHRNVMARPPLRDAVLLDDLWGLIDRLANT